MKAFVLSTVVYYREGYLSFSGVASSGAHRKSIIAVPKEAGRTQRHTKVVGRQPLRFIVCQNSVWRAIRANEFQQLPVGGSVQAPKCLQKHAVLTTWITYRDPPVRQR